MPKALRTFLGLPLREKIWFVLLFPLSGILRLIILVIPFRYCAWGLGDRLGNCQLRLLASHREREIAWRVGRIIRQVERFAPWEVKCLSQALLARMMCGIYGVPYVLHLGVRRNEEEAGPLKAHAWLAVGPWIVVGGEGHRTFTVVSTYVKPGVLGDVAFD
jgi:hypothetical protein